MCNQAFCTDSSVVSQTEFCDITGRNYFTVALRYIIFLILFPIAYNSAKCEFLKADTLHAMCLPEDTFLIDLESRLKQVFGLNNLAISENESQAKYVLLTLKKLERKKFQHLCSRLQAQTALQQHAFRDVYRPAKCYLKHYYKPSGLAVTFL